MELFYCCISSGEKSSIQDQVVCGFFKSSKLILCKIALYALPSFDIFGQLHCFSVLFF